MSRGVRSMAWQGSLSLKELCYNRGQNDEVVRLL
jgi:hypothetical protein